MLMIYSSIFLLLAAASLLFLGVNKAMVLAVFSGKTFLRKPLSQREKILRVQTRRKENPARRIISQSREILAMMGKEESFAVFAFSSLVCAFLGVFLSVLANNFFLVPVFGIGFLLLPFLRLLAMKNSFAKRVNEELESSLSIITQAFIRTEDITKAVEENIEYIDPPIRGAFEKFLVENKYINADTGRVLEKMKGIFGNDIFDEWLSGVQLCLNDIGKKVMLKPIVAKLSEVQAVSLELNVTLYEPLKEFVTMALLVILNIPLMRVLNKEWFMILTGTLPGKFIIAVSLACIIVGLFAMLKTLKPLEMKR
jgi:Flp pilus assembly protein TadB